MSITFCKEWWLFHRIWLLMLMAFSNNMLYPKEDKIRKKLNYACRNCGHSEPADNPRVYRNEILHSEEWVFIIVHKVLCRWFDLLCDYSHIVSSREKTVVFHDVAADPTLPRTNARCPKCEHKEAVVFQSAPTRANEAMVLYFVCVNCGHRWKE